MFEVILVLVYPVEFAVVVTNESVVAPVVFEFVVLVPFTVLVLEAVFVLMLVFEFTDASL